MGFFHCIITGSTARAFVFVIVLSCWSIHPCAYGEDAFTLEKALNLVQMHCLGCHGPNDPQADLDFTRYLEMHSVGEDLDGWAHILMRVRTGEMPPDYAGPLDEQLRELFVEWAEQAIHEAACSEGVLPGPAPVRRLNRSQYAATIRDLLGIHFNAGSNLPEDMAGGEGFDNAAETLFLSPVHLERYLEAAKEALDYASRDSAARQLLIHAYPDDELSEFEAARLVLERFATRAFRRPVEGDELARLMGIFGLALGSGESYEPALFYAMQAALVSPHFLFLVERPNPANVMQRVSDYELASRLSYFLWSSMPDEELFALAEEGLLHDEVILLEQVDRMLEERMVRRNSPNLEDRKFYEFASHFVSQWLGTRELGRNIRPDRERFPRYNQELEFALIYEPVYFFQDILYNDLSLLNLLKSDFTYVNRQLARHYNIHDEVEIQGYGQLVRVDLPEDSRRGGVLTMGGVLAVTSFPHRTSPVLRGAWVLDSVLGTPSPPPPPNVPELDDSHEDLSALSLREQLEMHRQNLACASCHNRIDPIGFGFENFDQLGQWRTEDGDKPIDASGQLTNGRAFDGPDELIEILMEFKDDFIRNLTIKMMAYALGRGLVIEDHCAIDEIAQRLEANGYSARTLLREIVLSIPFRYRQANEPTLAELEALMEEEQPAEAE